MEGIIEEGKKLMEEDASDDVMDAGLIAAAQKVEHYEIAAYGSVKAWAELLGQDEITRFWRKPSGGGVGRPQALRDRRVVVNAEAATGIRGLEEESSSEEESEEAGSEPRNPAPGGRAGSGGTEGCMMRHSGGV